MSMLKSEGAGALLPLVGRTVSVAVGLILVSLSQALEAQVVQTEYGPVSGVTSQGVNVFKGIPFAAPPVGKLRWQPPQPPAKWTSVRSAADYGHDCMQLPFPSDAAPLGTTPSEDCLVANVWAPAQATGHKLPVMFWIYGGGWVNGGSSPAVYDGSNFAKGGVVFVSFNYRLGRFGFFAHPALTKESHGGLLGNYGYMDQIAALKWVKHNIAAFGGDPDQITIFGESAGGFSVHMLMTTQLTDGLFQRSIVESGGGRAGLNTSYLHQVSPTGRPSAETIGVAFAKSKGIEGDGPEALDKLRALSAEALVDGLNMASMMPAQSTYAGPMIDGTIMRGEIGALYAAGLQHKVPMIVGANGADIGFNPAKTTEELYAAFGPNAKAAQQAYDPEGKGTLQQLSMKVGGDQFMVEPARFVAQQVAKGGQPVWEFRFSYVADSMRKEWAAAPHATEIPFVFDTVQSRYGAALTSADEKMAHQVNTYWLNFAKTGDPNGAKLPQWPAFQTGADRLMEFTDAGPVGGPDPWKTRLDLVQTLAQK